MSKIRSDEITAESTYQQRRDFIKKAALLGIGSIGGVGGRVLAQDSSVEVMTKLKTEMTSFEYITNYNNFMNLAPIRKMLQTLPKISQPPTGHSLLMASVKPQRFGL